MAQRSLRAGRNDWLVCQPFIHDMGVNQSRLRVAERVGQSPDDVVTELLPKAEGSRVGRYDKVELHCEKAKINARCLRMIAHQGGDALSTGSFRDDIAAVADM